ncbi:MAG: hypothetical protein ACSW8C_01420 [bacterium]
MGDLSLQKLSANRKNAQLSTGPKTVLGKAKSALNAVKHGIFTKECLKNISDEEARDYEVLKLGVFESLKPKDQMQAILCDKVIIDVWRLRKVLAFEQGAAQLEALNLDASDSAVNFIERRAIIYNMENHKSESEDLNQLKKWLTTKGVSNFSDLSDKACWFLEEIVQNLQQRFPENYRHMDIELLENCKHLSEFCTWNELNLDKFKADLLESIENKLRSKCGMSDYYENNLQEFDHKRSIYDQILGVNIQIQKL